MTGGEGLQGCVAWACEGAGAVCVCVCVGTGAGPLSLILQASGGRGRAAPPRPLARLPILLLLSHTLSPGSGPPRGRCSGEAG